MNNTNQPTITPELLEAAGYKCWFRPTTPTDEYPIVGKWQKLVLSDGGNAKYFININQHASMIGNDSSFMWWPSIQFDVVVGDTSKSIEISLVQWFNDSGKTSQISIEQMEVLLEKYWVGCGGLTYQL